MSKSQNVAVVRALMEAFERGDTEGQLALLDPDVEEIVEKKAKRCSTRCATAS